MSSPPVAPQWATARPSPLDRFGRTVVLALVIGLGIGHVYWAIADWHLLDMNAYWDAGVRIRMGEPLYPATSNPLASEVYRYSPWFAWMWAPLTLLPRDVVNAAWSLVLIGSSLVAMRPLARRRAWIAIAFFLPILIGISAGGNVQALLIAALVLGVDRRSGPAWIGAAASLKVLPVLLVLTYVGRRQWRRAALALSVGIVLMVPYLLYDLTHYVTSAGGAEMLSQWPPLYAAAAVMAALIALRLATSPFGWLASAATVALALPRFFVYDVTYLAVGLAGSAPKAVRSSAKDQ